MTVWLFGEDNKIMDVFFDEEIFGCVFIYNQLLVKFLIISFFDVTPLNGFF